MKQQRGWTISPGEFDSLVDKALRELPEPFLSLLENVAVVVEEEPGEEDFDELDAADDDPGMELLGIFRGIPRTEWSVISSGDLPNQVAIFRGPILRVSNSRADALAEIQETVIHELGHYFGLDDDHMPF
jgi:predicted Zn-dependent protease with MMP-like domain